VQACVDNPSQVLRVDRYAVKTRRRATLGYCLGQWLIKLSHYLVSSLNIALFIGEICNFWDAL
jgi:hypothetical protein